MKLYREMLTERVPCNVVTYNSLIDVAVRCTNMKVAAMVLQEMQASGRILSQHGRDGGHHLLWYEDVVHTLFTTRRTTLTTSRHHAGYHHVFDVGKGVLQRRKFAQGLARRERGPDAASPRR